MFISLRNQQCTERKLVLLGVIGVQCAYCLVLLPIEFSSFICVWCLRKNHIIIKRPVSLFVFTEVRLITAAAGLWSPLNNFLAFQIFLSFLSFFKTIGAGKIFGIPCADLKLYLR